MATIRTPTLRHLAQLRPYFKPSPRPCQRRWAQVQDVRFLATHGTHERVLAKYKDKLETKAKEQGLKDVTELTEAYKEKIDELRKDASVPGATAPLTPPPSPSSASASTSSSSTTNTASTTSSPDPTSPWPSPPPPPTPQDPNTPPPGVKTLNSFLDLDKVTTLPQKEIQALWRLRFASNPQSLNFALPTSTFAALLQTARKHPSFVLPLPREVPAEGESGKTSQAAELHFLQFGHPHVNTTTLMFTTLAEFKLKGEFASPHTTVSFHSELSDSHDLVLGQGIVMDNRGVSVDEARWLVMCMQKFYVVSEEGQGRGELLDMFTRGDGGFKVERLLEEAEKIV